MMAGPRVVFGMPAYNRPDALPQTLESLLSQTYRDLAIVIVDDAPSPVVQSIVGTYRALDGRVTYEPNGARLGMIANWRKAFERGRTLHPGSEYFAWVSDHDIWHPRWLEVLVSILDEQQQVVLAYPQILRLYAGRRRRIEDTFDTLGVAAPQERIRLTSTVMTAGNAIYGLFRARALEQAGVFRPVIMPDRQVLVELSVFGEFRHVPEFLWYREVAGAFSYRRQRDMFFPTRVPLHTYLPANVQHCGVMFWDLGIRGRGRPACGRLAGMWYAALQLWYSTRRALLREDAAWRVALRSTAVGRWLTRWSSTRAARADPGSASAATDTRTVDAVE